MDGTALAPKVVFLVGFASLGVFWLCKQLRFRAAINALEEQYRKEGKPYEYLQDGEMRMKFLRQEYSIANVDDSTAVQALKDNVVERHVEIVNSLKPLIIGAVVVLVLTICAGCLEFAIR